MSALGAAPPADDRRSPDGEQQACPRRGADHALLQRGLLKVRHAAAVAKDAAATGCTEAGDDPWSTGSEVACCPGSHMEKGQWSGVTMPFHWLCHAPPAATSAPGIPLEGAVEVRLLQWNVHWENMDSAGLAGIIEANHPDIIGLCELTLPLESMAQALTTASGLPFKTQPRGSTWVGYGTDIFYNSEKWEALEGGAEQTACADSKGGPRASNWVVLQNRASGSKLITGGTHTSYCEDGCDGLHACELGHTYSKFMEMKVKFDGAPVVWMGDLNRKMHSHVVQELLRGQVGRGSFFPVADLARTQTNTYYEGGSAIDHIFGEGAFRFERGGRTGQGVRGQHLMGADHFPIYTDVQLVEAAPHTR